MTTSNLSFPAGFHWGAATAALLTVYELAARWLERPPLPDFMVEFHATAGSVALLGVAVVVAAPLALHFWRVPADFFERANQVLAWRQLRKGSTRMRVVSPTTAALSTKAAADGKDVWIVSGDKDFFQLVGEGVTVLDPMKDVEYDPAGVEEKFGVGPDHVVDVQALAGDAGRVIGVDRFGASAPASTLFEHYGLTADAVAQAARDTLA